MRSKLYETLPLLPGEPSRQQQRLGQIIEAAIRSYATVGVEETSFERVAKACGVSRPLIHHYFPTKRDLFVTAVKYIRAGLQNRVVEAIKAHAEPRAQFEAYVAAHVDWVEENPVYAAVATLFNYYCAIDKNLKKLNSQLVEMGHERITALLANGVKAGVFPKMDTRVKAKAVQVFLTGLLLSLSTEGASHRPLLKEDMLRECEAILRR